jgi:hypothetical protein
MTEHDFSPTCCICGRISAVVKLLRAADEIRFIYGGLSGSNGAGSLITKQEAITIQTAYAPPVTAQKLKAIGHLPGSDGFCTQCSLFYCSAHWKISSTGGGRCPEGHFETLDPHWSPDD